MRLWDTTANSLSDMVVLNARRHLRSERTNKQTNRTGFHWLFFSFFLFLLKLNINIFFKMSFNYIIYPYTGPYGKIVISALA